MLRVIRRAVCIAAFLPVIAQPPRIYFSISSDRTFAPGMEPSRFFWAPSIAPSGLAIYRGDRYPGWNGQFFVGALAARMLARLRIGAQTGLFVEEERMFGGLKARIRDVRAGADGFLYLLTDDRENGMLLRLVPRAPGE